MNEASLRRLADREGLKLHKIRGRDDEYFLADVQTRGVMFPWNEVFLRNGINGASLDEIREYLTE